MKQSVYLDFAAATPLDSEVRKAIIKKSQDFSNPSAVYESGRRESQQLTQARKTVAKFLQANSEEIVFTANATEANNLALLGSARAAGGGHIVAIKSEHASVREPIKQLEQEGFEVSWCELDKSGHLSPEVLESALQKDTILVSVSYASSEIGTIQALASLVSTVKKYNPKIIFHTDASGAALTLPCDVSRLGVDLLSIGGSKLYGPHGIGALYVRRGVKLQPIFFGGGQEGGLRPGSQAVDLAVGLAKALEIVAERRKADTDHMRACYLHLRAQLLQIQPQPVYVGDEKNRIFSTLCICFDGISGEDLVAHLDARGFEVSSGAACEASYAEPSAALLALGLTHAQAQGSLRISFGRATTTAQLDAFAIALKESLALLRQSNLK